MADVSELLADLEKLKAARRSGATEIWTGSDKVTFRSDRDLTKAIAAVEAEIAQLQGSSRPKNVVLRSLPFRGW